MKYFFLILIVGCGGGGVWHTLLPVPPRASQVSASFNMLVFYMVCAIVYLSANRGKVLGFLLIYSLIVIGFIVKMALSFYASR